MQFYFSDGARTIKTIILVCVKVFSNNLQYIYISEQ
jgi:hypothetical protein